MQKIHLFAILLLLAFSLARPLNAEILVKDGDTVAFMGDSITNYGANHSYGYVNLVVQGFASQGIKINPIFAGIGGHKSNDMLARLDRDVISKKPTWMTLSCGVNDVWHQERNQGVLIEDYKKNITEILDKLKAASIKTVVLTPTMIKEDQTNKLNQMLIPYVEFLRQIAKERSLPLADLNDFHQKTLKALPADSPYKALTADGVHMNPHGDMMMAEGVLRAFGFSDAQIAKTKEAWLTKNDNYALDFKMVLPGISLKQFESLEAKKVNMNDVLQNLYWQSVAETAKDPKTANLDIKGIQDAIGEKFRQNVDGLLKK